METSKCYQILYERIEFDFNDILTIQNIIEIEYRHRNIIAKYFSCFIFCSLLRIPIRSFCQKLRFIKIRIVKSFSAAVSCFAIFGDKNSRNASIAMH